MKPPSKCRKQPNRPARPPSAFTPEGKHRVLAVGPDVTVPLATRHKVISLVTVRYLREFGARSKMQGSTLVALLAFPVPSMAIR